MDDLYGDDFVINKPSGNASIASRSALSSSSSKKATTTTFEGSGVLFEIGPWTHVVCIAGLPWWVNDRDLKEDGERSGEVRGVVLERRADNGKSTGRAMVWYGEESEAKKCVEQMRGAKVVAGKDLGGFVLEVGVASKGSFERRLEEMNKVGAWLMREEKVTSSGNNGAKETDNKNNDRKREKRRSRSRSRERRKRSRSRSRSRGRRR